MTNTRRTPILFAHSAGSQSGPGEGSFGLVECLRRELPDQDIRYPVIEDPEAPTYEMYKKIFDEQLTAMEQPVIVIGHSLGASMLVKYLGEEQAAIEISAMFLVASPHWGSDGWDIEQYALKEDPSLVLPPSINVFLYHSIDDPEVPFEHLEFYKKLFPHAAVRSLKGDDHVFADGLPELVEDLRQFAKNEFQ